ncbi:MAG: lipoyl(octanoyl) transferase LipB, partial [Alphaproteobacteria bacterium]
AEAVRRQEAAVADVLAGGPEKLIFAEHAPIYTLGTSAKAADVLHAGTIPVVETGRGGQVTYHGPGQRVVYPILNLTTREQDLRWYVRQLQNWVVATLAELGIEGKITDDVGVWVNTPAGEAKIAAIGIRCRKWVTYHGFALNVQPNLTAYHHIIPCGLTKPITSLHALGCKANMQQVDDTLRRHYPFTLATPTK